MSKVSYNDKSGTWPIEILFESADGGHIHCLTNEEALRLAADILVVVRVFAKPRKRNGKR